MTSVTADVVGAPEVVDLGGGVHAYVQPDGTWGLNNTGFLVGSEGVLAVDTCMTVRRTEAFLAAIVARTDRPVRTLVNTHHHGDHTHGNFLLPHATIVGHEECRRLVLATGHTTTALFPGVDFGDFRVAPPFVTFTDRLNLYVDDLLVEAHHVGTPAHTTNDVVYWVPERRVLFAGDLAFNGGTPFVLMGSVAGSLEALERVRALDADVVVPGHGPVCDPTVFDEQAAYLTFVQEVAADAHAAGRSPLEAARGADLGRFAAWPDRERLVGNLHRAYSELRGEPRGTPLDLGVVAPDMLAYNDGRPLRSHA